MHVYSCQILVWKDFWFKVKGGVCTHVFLPTILLWNEEHWLFRLFYCFTNTKTLVAEVFSNFGVSCQKYACAIQKAPKFLSHPQCVSYAEFRHTNFTNYCWCTICGDAHQYTNVKYIDVLKAYMLLHVFCASIDITQLIFLYNYWKHIAECMTI